MTTTRMRVQSGSFPRSLRNLSDTADWRQRLERVWIALRGFLRGHVVFGNSLRLTAPPFTVLGAGKLPRSLAAFVGTAEKMLLPELPEDKAVRAEDLAMEVADAMRIAIWFELVCLAELLEASIEGALSCGNSARTRRKIVAFAGMILLVARNLETVSGRIRGWNRNSKAVISRLRDVLRSLEKPHGQLDAALRSASRARIQLGKIGAIRIVSDRPRRAPAAYGLAMPGFVS